MEKTIFSTKHLHPPTASSSSLLIPPFPSSFKGSFPIHGCSLSWSLLVPPQRHHIPSRTGNHILLSCQSTPDPVNDSKPRETNDMQRKPRFRNLLKVFRNFGKKMKENSSPQQKGDWKDLVLMSLSFAVYVYMSQQIVCAYFAWMSIPKQTW